MTLLNKLMITCLVLVLGFGAFSVQAGVIPPAAVTDLAVTANCNSTNTLTWSSSSGATGYYIYRSLSSTFSGGPYATVSASPYTDTSHTSSKCYYKVVAYNSGGSSPDSNLAITFFKPASPTSISARQISGPGIRISWSRGSNTPTGYLIYRSDCYNTDGTVVGYTLEPTHMFEDTSVSDGRDYYYRVYAYNGYWHDPELRQTSCYPSDWIVRKACSSSDVVCIEADASSTHLFDCVAWYDSSSANHKSIFLYPDTYIYEHEYTTQCPQYQPPNDELPVVTERRKLKCYGAPDVPLPVLSLGQDNQFDNNLAFDTCDPCMAITLFSAGDGGPLIEDFDIVASPDLNPSGFLPCLVTSYKVNWVEWMEKLFGIWECHAFVQVYTSSGWTDPVSVGSYSTNGGNNACDSDDALVRMPVSVCRAPLNAGVVVSRGGYCDINDNSCSVLIQALDPYTGIPNNNAAPVSFTTMYQIRKIDSVMVHNTDSVLVAITSYDTVGTGGWYLQVLRVKQNALYEMDSVSPVFSTQISGVPNFGQCWPKLASSNLSDDYAAVLTYNRDDANCGGYYVTFSYDRQNDTFSYSQAGTHPGRNNHGLSLLGSDYSFVGCGSDSNWWKGSNGMHIDRGAIQSYSSCGIGVGGIETGVRSCGLEPDDVQPGNGFGLGYLMFPYYNPGTYNDEFYVMPYYNIYPCTKP